MGGSRAKLVNTAFAYLYNSLTEVLQADQLDVKLGVFSFDTELYTLKDFDEEKNGEQALAEYSPRGGTRILKNLQKVIQKMEEGVTEKKIVILLTDADVWEDELLNLKNNIDFEDVKVIFIGIECNQYRFNNSSVHKELFMDNIEEDRNVVQILTNALIRSVG